MKQGKPTKEEMVLAAVRASNKDQRELVEKYKQPNKANEKVLKEAQAALHVLYWETGKEEVAMIHARKLNDFVESVFNQAILLGRKSERKRLLGGMEKLKKRKHPTGERPWCVVCFNRIRKEVTKLINNSKDE